MTKIKENKLVQYTFALVHILIFEIW